jgi:hypothetical protein
LNWDDDEMKTKEQELLRSELIFILLQWLCENLSIIMFSLVEQLAFSDQAVYFRHFSDVKLKYASQI